MNSRLIAYFVFYAQLLVAQTTTYDYAVPLMATHNDSNSITRLDFTTSTSVSHFDVYRRLPGDPNFGSSIATLAGGNTFYIDSTTLSGQAYEYKIEKYFTNNSQKIGYGYIQAGQYLLQSKLEVMRFY